MLYPAELRGRVSFLKTINKLPESSESCKPHRRAVGARPLPWKRRADRDRRTVRRPDFRRSWGTTNASRASAPVGNHC